MPTPIYPTNTNVWGMWRDKFDNWWNDKAETNKFIGATDRFLNGPKDVESLNIMDNPAIALQAGVPGFKKLQSFEELEALRKTMEAAEEGKTLVNASKNVRAGKRPRVKTGTTEKRYVKTTPLSQSSEALAAKEARNAQLAAEAKAAEVKSNQIDLARQQRRQWEEQGINTPAKHKQAMMRAIEINPSASTPPPEGLYPTPYTSGAVEWEGAPISDWLNMATEGNLPHGPNALWRKWEKPLQSATNWNNAVGPIFTKDGIEASQTALDMLGQGLAEMAPYLKRQGGVVSAKSGIHIKKENRGKFSKSAKSAGEGVQEHAHKVMNNPNATALQRKRANFAIQAKKWARKHKHLFGGIIKGQDGMVTPNIKTLYNDALNITKKYGYDKKPLTLSEWLFSDHTSSSDSHGIFGPLNNHPDAYGYLSDHGLISKSWDWLDIHNNRDYVISKMSDEDALNLYKMLKDERIEVGGNPEDFINEYEHYLTDDYGDESIGQIVYEKEYKTLGNDPNDYSAWFKWLRSTHPEYYYNHWYGNQDDEYDTEGNLKPKPQFNRNGGVIMPNWAYNMIRK